MEGLNYEFHCHHAADFFDEIFINDVTLSPSDTWNVNNDRVDISPRSTVTSYGRVYNSDYEYLRNKALDIAQRANIFTDVQFLYSPCDVAFAIAAIATGSVSYGRYGYYCIGSKLLRLYMDMHPDKFQDEASVTSTLRNVILSLLRCQNTNICPFDHPLSKQIVAERAEELRRKMGEVATLRLLRKMNSNTLIGKRYKKNSVVSTTFLDTQGNFERKRSRFGTVHVDNIRAHRSSKRTRTLSDTNVTPPGFIRSCAKVTPTTTGYYFGYMRNDATRNI